MTQGEMFPKEASHGSCWNCVRPCIVTKDDHGRTKCLIGELRKREHITFRQAWERVTHLPWLEGERR